MSNYLAIDGGTTNTRIAYIKDGMILDSLSISYGAGSNADGSHILERKIKQGVEKLLTSNHITEQDVDRILASGMITSEFGLCNLPHTTLPCDCKKLHNTMVEIALPEISKIPFIFVRGIKNIEPDLAYCDMMRGEETELYGIRSMGVDAELYVLPGTHSKVISVEQGEIRAFSTMFSGEMIAALSRHTILKSVIDLKNAKTDEEFLFKGYTYAKEHGINQALFKVRIMNTILGGTPDQCYSFFLGCVLAGDINTILRTGAKRIAVGGKASLREPICMILKHVSDKEIICVEDEIVKKSVFHGLMSIYEYK